MCIRDSATIGKHGTAQLRRRLTNVRSNAELPGRDAFGPVAANVGHVAVLFGEHDKGQLPRATGVAQWGVRGDDDSFGVSAAAPEHLVVAAALTPKESSSP